MARPKQPVQGRSVSLYLSPARLDFLGENPTKAIGRLIDEAMKAIDKDSEVTPQAIGRKKKACANCTRTNGGIPRWSCRDCK